MLTDLNPAYHTLPTGPDGERAVYGPGHDSHDGALRDAPAAAGTDLGRWAVVQIAVVVDGVLLVAVAALGLPPVEPTARARRMKAVAVVHAASVSDQLQSLIHSLGVPPLAFPLAFVAGAAHAVLGRVTAWCCGASVLLLGAQ